MSWTSPGTAVAGQPATAAFINVFGGDLTYLHGGLLEVWGDLQSKSATYTALTTDGVILCTANTFTVTLFAASGNAGKRLLIKNNGSGIVTIDANGSETIDGALTIVLFEQYEWIEILCDGTNWAIVDGSTVITPRCDFYHDTSQAFAASTPAVFSMNSETEDVGAMHDTVTNNGRATIPTGGAGRYRIEVLATTTQDSSGTDGAFTVSIRVNGSNVIDASHGQGTAVALNTSVVTYEARFAVGDYVEIYGDPGGRAFTSSSSLHPRMRVKRIGR